MATPRKPPPIIEATIISTIRSTTGTVGSSEPPSWPSTPQPMNAPTISTSPWAKLRSLRIP
jgi:hypothetical protein